MDRKEQEHKRILDYFKNGDGKNLHLLDDNLVLYSPSNPNIREEDYNSTEEYGDKLFEDDFKPYFTNCDLTCFNENDNSLIVLELKTEKADYKTFGQILFYLLDAEVLEYANEKKVKKIQGIILASEIDKSLRKLVKKYKSNIPEISFKEYKWTDDGKLLIENV